MAEKELPNGKLIILFMLSNARSIPSADLLAWALESLYFDYFTFAQARAELLRDRLITEYVRKGETRMDSSGHPIELCDITPDGEVILNQLMFSLPSGVRSYLSSSSADWKKKTLRESSVLASYRPDANGAFQVKLTLLDGARMSADITLTAPDEATAEQMCRRWKESTAGIYTALLSELQSGE